MGSSIDLMPSSMQSCEYFMESGWDNVEQYYVNQKNVNFFCFFPFCSQLQIQEVLNYCPLSVGREKVFFWIILLLAVQREVISHPKGVSLGFSSRESFQKQTASEDAAMFSELAWCRHCFTATWSLMSSLFMCCKTGAGAANQQADSEDTVK